MSVNLIPERVAQLETIAIDGGGHSSFERGHCAMEIVAWVAGEPHSDRPQCACPVLSSAARRLNDRCKDGERGEVMRPLLLALAGSKADRKTEIKRGYALADYAVRVAAADAMESAKLPEQAAILRAADKICDKATAIAGRDKASAARGADAAAYAADAADAAYAARKKRLLAFRDLIRDLALPDKSAA